MVDLLGRTPAAGDRYLIAGIVRAIESGTLLVIPGPGHSPIRVAEGDVVRLQDLAAIAYVDQQDGVLAAAAAATYQTIIGAGNRAAVRAALGVPHVEAIEVGDPVRTVGNNSTAEATLWSLALPPPGATGEYRIDLFGDAYNFSGASVNLTPRFKFDGTTILGDVGSIASGSQRRGIWWRFSLSARNATDKQMLLADFPLGDAAGGSPSIAGESLNLFGQTPPTLGKATASADWTSSKTALVSVQFGTAHASVEARLFRAVCTYIPPPP